MASHGEEGVLLAGTSVMAVPVKCPKGHWFEPNASGEATLCPHCKAQSRLQSGRTISEDEVLDILDPPKTVDISTLPSEPSEEPAVEEESHKSSLQRRKKVCPVCFFETSFSFGCCPRCGSPLEIASIDVS